MAGQSGISTQISSKGLKILKHMLISLFRKHIAANFTVQTSVDTDAGKTSIVRHFTTDYFESNTEPTVGIPG